MSTIKNILDKLNDQEKKQLMYAFENNFTQFVEYENGKYIGVNTSHVKNLSIRQAAGVWYEGDIKKENK